MLGLILDILCWNVRGLNDQARKDTVHATLSSTTCHIACIQETKLDFIDHQTAGYIGGFRLCSFSHRPATGTRGGILLLWDEDHVSISNIHIGTHLLSADVSIKSCGTVFKITTVYGPSSDADKESFLQEATAEMPADPHAKWLILGDFNLIYQACDKNNGNLNLRLMGKFRHALKSCELKEIKCTTGSTPEAMSGRTLLSSGWTERSVTPTGIWLSTIMVSTPSPLRSRTTARYCCQI
jgi:exonuclease III